MQYGYIDLHRLINELRNRRVGNARRMNVEICVTENCYRPLRIFSLLKLIMSVNLKHMDLVDVVSVTTWDTKIGGEFIDDSLYAWGDMFANESGIK